MTDPGRARIRARLYRAVSRVLLPAPFRRAFGDDMTRVFCELCDAERARGGWRAVARVWMVEVRQLITVGRHERRGSRDTVRDRRRRLDPNHRAGPGEAWSTIWAEFRHALRVVARRPVYALTVVAVLGTGLGLNAVVLSVARATVAATLPYEDPDRLFVLGGTMRSAIGVGDAGMTIVDLVEYRKAHETFEDLAIWSLWGNVTLRGEREAERWRATFATSAYFRLLRRPPLLGRTFAEIPDETVPRVVVLSYNAWRTRFGADPNVIGTEIWISGHVYTILGVMPGEFRDVTRTGIPQMWIPLRWGRDLFGHDMYYTRSSSNFHGVVRLAEGVTRADADSVVARIARELHRDHPQVFERGARLRAVPESSLGGLRHAMVVVVAGAGLVLVVCTLNVAALVAQQAAGRDREFALRSAIGGSRVQVARVVLTEVALLGALGGAAAFGIAWGGLGAFRATFGRGLPRFAPIQLDPVVLAVSATLLVGIVAVAAAWPAWRTTRFRFGGGARGVAGALRGGRPGTGMSVIIIGEVALAVVLLVGASLMARSLYRAVHADVGYEPENLLTMRFDFTAGRFAAREGREPFIRAFTREAERLPGVERTALLGPGMVGSFTSWVRVIPTGHDFWSGDPRYRARWMSVTPGAMAAMGIRLRAGRDFTWADGRDAAAAVIISEDLAQTLWPGEEAVGRTVYASWDSLRVGTVIGVTTRAPQVSRFAETGFSGDVYYSVRENAPPQLAGVVRLAPGADIPTITAGLRAIVRGLDPDIPMFDVMMMTDRNRAEEGLLRLMVVLTAIYASVAALLAFVGTSGLLASVVRRRRGEMAIRAVVGAGRPTLFGLVFRQGMVPVFAGLLLGLGGAVSGVRFVEGFLFDLAGTDAATYASVIGLVILAAVVACYPQARRARRADPMEALRVD